ncbi:hypothetical protein [Aquibacillus koreensis]
MMRKILAMKLTMDQRRVPTIFNQSKNKETGNQFFKSLGLYALYGLILIPFIVMGDHYVFQMSIVFGISMFILMTSMISDFSTVLLDVRDKAILDTKPVKKKTISASKIVHVSIYMIQLTGAFALIPIIVSIFVKGILFGLIFILEIILIGLFIVVLTALVYIFILRFFNGERLKDIINYVQILLSVGIAVGYQVLIRSFEFVDLDVTFHFQWWHIFIPPMWYGAPFELILNQNGSKAIILFSILALIVPLISIFIYALLVPSFERNLQKLLNNSGDNKKKKLRVDRFWQKVMCRTKEERTFYLFAIRMMKQEREFKLKVYPLLGMSFIFPFIFVANFLSMESFGDLSNTKMYLTIYFINIIIPSIVHMVKFSGKYKGAWIYRATPIQDQASIYRATLKAFLVKLYFPVFFVTSIVFVSIHSFTIILDLAVVLAVAFLHTIISYKALNNELYPFSQSFAFAQETNVANNILMMIIGGVFAGIHFIASVIPFGLYGYLVILIVVNLVLWQKGFRTS